MARKTMTIAAGLLLAGVTALGGTPPQASAAPIGAVLNQASTVGEFNGMVEHVQSRRRYRDYHRRYHGPRYRHRRPGYGYYHRGYYYRTPWWVGPAVGLGIAGAIAGAAGRAAGSSAHVAWCQDRYRSYDPSTDSYMGYDGRRHRCYSPYS
ncbi:BA14K family protein [Rhodoligotrophos defluvii]|uniref:BA14K family protein n=1 Tax=Rhodoligotrophos defluvii TaxID=2561934 RepID=UPI001EF052DF|nr:BA14K family protein [Rhodoligotrophos defluvii]